MFGITNWKTTLAGAVSIFGQVAQVIPQLQPYSNILNEISIIAAGTTGFLAKDANVTGGTIAATREAESRTDSPAVK